MLACRRPSRSLALAAALCFLLTALAPGGAAAAPQAAARKGEYRGTASVTIRYCDLDEAGEPACAAKKTYKRPVSVFIASPDKCGSVSDSNPFRLHIAADQDPDNPRDGEFWLLSGGRTVTASARCVVIQHWKLKMKGDAISGTLTSDGGVDNRLWATTRIAGGLDMAWPFAMETGAALRGTIAGDTITLRIEGRSADHTRPFTIALTARRANTAK
jgi:hypothetical protein